MKKQTLLPIWLVLSLPLFGFQCSKLDDVAVYKGKLAVAGVCGNYTIVILEGTMPSNLYEDVWVDPHAGTTHRRAFRLENICSFPSSIQEGDEFYFSLRSNNSNGCVTCMAYYPTPEKKLSIRVFP